LRIMREGFQDLVEAFFNASEDCELLFNY
jgi:hypothetical protein